MIVEAKRYKCKHCGTIYVILPTRTGSHLPVEVREGREYFSDNEYDKNVHTSHLKTCEKRREDWPLIQAKIKEQQSSENKEFAKCR